MKQWYALCRAIYSYSLAFQALKSAKKKAYSLRELMNTKPSALQNLNTDKIV